MKASASKSALLLHCAYWARDDVEWPKEKPSKAAARGTEVHGHIAAYVNRGIIPSFDTDDWVMRRAWLGIRRVKVEPVRSMVAEASYAMNIAGGSRFLGHEISRDVYPIESFCGTVDLIIKPHEHVGILDWKTGSPSDGDEWQLRTLAAIVTEIGVNVGSARAAYLTEDNIKYGPNVLEGTNPLEDAETIRKRLRMIPDSKPEPGYWCKSLYCSIRTTCPAHP